MHAPPLFAADSIGKSFGSRTILKAASVWARPGTISVLFGRNGCGKSTLLKVGAGLLRADHGVIQFDGRSYLRPHLSELAARGLFYLPDRDFLSRRLTVGEQIQAVEWRFGGSRTAGVVERLDIGHLMSRTPVELSGGERRRVEIATALIRAPRCLLADEPFAGIDPADAEVLAGTLRSMAREGCAIVITGHEVRQLLDVADDIVWMAGGSTHGMGTPQKAMQHEQFRREYLGALRFG
jgi:lipopolysaccharide export system ATP-binding protein